MNTAKNEVFCWLQHEGCYLVERFTFGGGEQKFSGRGLSTGGEFFQVGGGGHEEIFGWWEDSTIPPQQGKP